jgi:Sulfotransferase family
MNQATGGRVSADALLDKVTRELGLTDFGDDRYVGEYQRAVDAINAEVTLTPMGVAILEEWIQRTLTNMLRMQRDLKAHPEIRDEVLAPPIVISGFARTGTTKLQRLISMSPATQSLQLWKLLNPAPFDDADPNAPDPRIAFAQEAAKMAQQAFPEMWAAHPTPPLDAEEDFLLHDMTFIAPTDGMRCGATRLMEALTPMNVRVYEFLRTMLKYLQWQDRGANRASRPWVLKSPIHIGNVSTLLQVFPGAKFVFCHRDVEVAMASLCSLDEIARLMLTDQVDRIALGNEVLEYWAREWNRNLQQRAQLDPDSFCDIQFDDINRNGMAVAEKVHAFAGLRFDEAARKAMAEWEAVNPRHQGGKHEYTLEKYGLTRRRVRNAYAAYYDYFADSGIAIRP